MDVERKGVFLWMKKGIPNGGEGGRIVLTPSIAGPNGRGGYAACAAPKAWDGGSIVITSSIAGLIGREGLVAYHASEHAVVGIMRTTARELGSRNIRVNTVHPGYVESQMMRNIEKGVNPDASDSAKEDFLTTVPMGRYA